MQPDKNSQWRQPDEQPSGAPFAAMDDDTHHPIVTMTPDEPDEASAQVDASDDSVVRWQAAEYIHHHRSLAWYAALGLVTLSLTAAAIYFSAWTFAILVPVMAAALVTYSHRPPRLLDYALSRKGLHINDRLYSFSEFKGFGVIHDGDEFSIMLIPTKRFQPGVSVFFPEESGEAIVDMLAARLPMLDLKLDVIDRLIRRLRM